MNKEMSTDEKLSAVLTILEGLVSTNAAKQNELVYLNVKEAADLVCKSPHTVYAMVSRRAIPHLKIGNKVLFKRQELIDWLEKGRRATTSEIVDALRSSVSTKIRQKDSHE